MSKPIKVEDRSTRLSSAWLAFKEEFISRRVGIDRYKHFGIVVNWRCTWALIQAVLAFEMFLAIAFAGRGWSLFGRLFETRVVPLIDNQVIWASICLIAAMTGFGLWHNRRWAFLLESAILTLLCAGFAISNFQDYFRAASWGSLVVFIVVFVQLLPLPYRLYKRYRDFDCIVDDHASLQENPIPAKNS